MNAPSRDGWTRCPPGSFQRLGAVLAARQLRRLWLTRLALAVAALLGVAACWESAVVIDAWRAGVWSQPIPGSGGPGCPASGNAPAQAPGCAK